jgi:lipoprotein LprG
MPRRHLRLLALLAALITGLVTSCGGGGGGGTNAPPQPDGAELLAKSAAAMREVTSVRFGIDVDGVLTIAGVQVKSATGQLTNKGSAKGNATADMGRQLYELTFVIIGKDLYLRGPTGGFSKLSAASLSAFTVLLNPDRGIAGVLASGAAAENEGREQVGGVDSYRVKASFSGQSLVKLLPGPTEDVTGEVWIAADDSRVVQAVFPIDDGNVTFRFSDFIAPADITAPE